MSRNSSLSKKIKSRNTREADWEPLKARIVELHILQGISLNEVRDILKDEVGFNATIRQYRSRISKWNLDKNVKSSEMRFIAQKQAQRKINEPHKAPLRFRVRGIPVDSAKIERWKARTGFDDSEIPSPQDTPSTPSGLSYTTEYDERSLPSSPVEDQQTFSFITENLSLKSPFGTTHTNLDWAPTELGVSYDENEDANPVPGNLKLVIPGRSPQEGLILPEVGNVMLQNAELDAQKEQVIRQRLGELEGIYGIGQPGTLKELEELGCILLRQRRWKAAEENITKLLGAYRQWYGEQHETTLWAARLLGDAILGQGQWTKAERIHQETYDLMKLTQGPDSPQTLSCLAALANNLSVQARHREASILGLHLFDSSFRLLGPNHPLTIVRAAKLAESYFHIGQCDRAESLFVQVLSAGPLQPSVSSEVCVDHMLA